MSEEITEVRELLAEAEGPAREAAGWGLDGAFEEARPLQVRTGSKPGSAVFLWKGRQVPYVERVTLRHDGVVQVIFRAPDGNAGIVSAPGMPPVSDIPREVQHHLRRGRESMAAEMRSAGIAVEMR